MDPVDKPASLSGSAEMPSARSGMAASAPETGQSIPYCHHCGSPWTDHSGIEDPVCPQKPLLPPFCDVQGCRGRWDPELQHDRCRRAGDQGILLLANRIGKALEVCWQVENNPEGWGGPMAVSLARTIRRELIDETREPY